MKPMNADASQTHKRNLTTDSNISENVKRRRPRGVIVCMNCRKRKIKCDKQRPCSNCTRFNQASSCSYEPQRNDDGKDGFFEIQFPITAPQDSGFGRSKKQNGDVERYPVSNRISECNTKTLDEVSDSSSKIQGSEPSEIDILKERIQQIEQSLQATRLNYPIFHPNARSFYHDQRSSNLGPSTHSVSTFPSTSTSNLSLISSKQEQNSPLTIPTAPRLLNSLDGQPINGFTSFPPLSHHFTVHDDAIRKGEYHSTSLQAAMRPEAGNKPSLLSSNIYQQRSHQVETPKLESTAQGSIGDLPYLIGTNLFSRESDTINFYEGYSSIHYKDHLRRLNFGPFAWSSLMKRDVGLRTVWDYVVSKKEKILNKGHSAALMFAQPTGEVSDENTETLFSTGKDSDQLEQQFQRRALQTDGVDDMIPYKTIIQARQNAHKQKALLNKHALPLGLTVYDGRLDCELQLIEKIEVVLPKKRVLWKLIHRFFQSMYTYMPFIDEDYFRQDLERIIGPQSFEDVSISHIKIEKKLDLATIGILLIILRLAYLSLFSNNSSLNEFILNSAHPNKENALVQYLMKNPININTIDVASLCLDQFQVLRRSNFTVLQLALFLRLYHTYAPEDGDGADGGDSQVLNSVLIQTAFSLGMNREPDEQYTDPKMNHLIRKIWIFLVASDLHLSYSFGNPITIDDMHYDINPPVCDPGSENLRDKSKDWASTNRLNWCLKLSPKLRHILQCALNIKGRTSLPKLCEDISEFELNLHNDIGSINDFIVCTGMDELAVANRNMKVKVYLALKSFLISIFFHLYLHYEENDPDVSFFYLKKSLLTTIGDIMPHYVTLLGESEVISDMIINPTLEMTIHKSNQINLSIIVRVNFLIFHLKQSRDHERLCKVDSSYFTYFQLLCQLSSAVTRAAEFTISAISKLSNRYYYAWRITRGQTYLLKTITLTQFYEDNYHKASQIYSTRYKPDQIRELVGICEKTLSDFSHTEFCTYGFAKHMKEDLYRCNEMPTGSMSTSITTPINTPDKTSTNAEIDKLWLQVLSIKHNTSLTGNLQDNPLTSKAPLPLPWDLGDMTSQTQKTNESNVGDNLHEVDRTGFDMEMANRFDIFSEMPFEDMLDL